MRCKDMSEVEVKADSKANAASYVLKQDICGVPQDVRRLTVPVYERAVESAIGRGLLGRGDRDNPWIARGGRRHI